MLFGNKILIFGILFMSTYGHTAAADKIPGRIINGTLASAAETKHQVSLRKRLQDSYLFGTGHICGGSLITANVVLTAAHCFVDYDSENYAYNSAKDFVVVMGNLDRFLNNENTLISDFTVVFRMAQFNTETYENDLALLFLSGSVPANHPTVQPILLNRQAPVAHGTICQVTGWGENENGYLPDLLMTVDVPAISSDVCIKESEYAELILEGMMCAGYLDVGERDACQGDSGGPLVCNGQLAGLVSWGIECALPKLPGVYTDVIFYIPWIDEQIKAANDALPGEAGGSANLSLNISLQFLVYFLVTILVVNKVA